jgi:type IV secretory pathway VirD2 relaxase
MRQMENDLGTRLDWGAADHLNTAPVKSVMGKLID